MSPAGSSESPANSLESRRSVHWLLALALVVFTFLNFASVRRFEFVHFDDQIYVTENPMVTAGLTWRGFVWAMTTGHGGNWHPLTWLSHMLDVQLFGMNPGAHHLVNAGFHALNAVLLFVLLQQATGAVFRSAFVAALFAVHPLHVESVAWIAERKDVLSTCLWMLTLLAYLSFVRRSNARRYAAVVLCFALALLAKPMVVTLPAVLLLLDVWPLRRIALWRDERSSAANADHPRISRVILEKAPLLLLAAMSSVMTVVMQRRWGAVGGLNAFPMPVRIENALLSYIGYVRLLLWPAHLSAFYPYRESMPMTAVVGATILLVVITAVAVRGARRRPYLLVGWLWYVVTLMPVVGIVQVGKQSMADRYTYVPMIGLFIIVAWAGAELLVRVSRRRVVAPIAAALVLGACSLQTQVQLRTWQNGLTLWQRSVDVSPDNAYGLYNLGVVLVKAGRLDEGISRFREALRVDSNYADVHIDLGNALDQRGATDEALAEFAAVVRLRPDYADARVAYGALLHKRGRDEDAMVQYREALRLNPDLASAHNELGNVLSSTGQFESAATEYAAAVRLAPEFPEAHNNLGTALARAREYDRALAEFATALRLKPDDARFHYNAALMLEQLGRIREAVDHLQAALRADPNNVTVSRELARLTTGSGGGAG